MLKFEEFVNENIRRKDIVYTGKFEWKDGDYMYRLCLIDGELHSRYPELARKSGRWVVQVQQYIGGEWRLTPGSWYWHDIKNLDVLHLQGREWVISVPRQAWREIEEQVQKLNEDSNNLIFEDRASTDKSALMVRLDNLLKNSKVKVQGDNVIVNIQSDHKKEAEKAKQIVSRSFKQFNFNSKKSTDEKLFFTYKG